MPRVRDLLGIEPPQRGSGPRAPGPRGRPVVRGTAPAGAVGGAVRGHRFQGGRRSGRVGPVGGNAARRWRRVEPDYLRRNQPEEGIPTRHLVFAHRFGARHSTLQQRLNKGIKLVRVNGRRGRRQVARMVGGFRKLQKAKRRGKTADDDPVRAASPPQDKFHNCPIWSHRLPETKRGNRYGGRPRARCEKNLTSSARSSFCFSQPNITPLPMLRFVPTSISGLSGMFMTSPITTERGSVSIWR